MTTYEDLIRETRHELMTGHPDRINVLSAGVDATTSTIPLRYPSTGIKEGSKLHIGLEEMHVVAITNTGSTSSATVIRDYTPTTHNVDDRVYVNPQFADKHIARYINTGLDQISGDGLFQFLNAVPLTSSISQSYDLGSLPHFISLWRVRYDVIGPQNNWPVLRPDEYWLDTAPDTTDFPGGTALFLRYTLPLGRRIHVTYKAGFEHLTNLTDDVLAVSGLHTEAHDILPLWAAICMLAGREVKRSFLDRQPEPRRQEEVPPGAANQAMLPLIHRYEDRIKAERKRLHRRYPGAV